MEVSYKVDKENKVVVCFGKDTAFDVLDDLKSSYDETTPLEALSPFMIRDMFVAKVKCDERDEFDEFVGKKLAYKRMMAKYIDAKQKQVNILLADLYSHENRLKEILSNYEVMRP